MVPTMETCGKQIYVSMKDLHWPTLTYIDPRANLRDGNDAPTSVEKGSALNLLTSHFNQPFPPLASDRLLEKTCSRLSRWVTLYWGRRDLYTSYSGADGILGATYFLPRGPIHTTYTPLPHPYCAQCPLPPITWQNLSINTFILFPHAISLWNNLPSNTVIYLTYTILMRQCVNIPVLSFRVCLISCMLLCALCSLGNEHKLNI